ncbi:Ribonuclease D [Anatilimnocola aggregata]|uniref:Ribonuclease D n=1 Tax=Anatilimnocola aggregata TaxID=2528021 RepID=A0A517YDS7_9BACT|nr:HRDC domain-containing protein [Anatilimnocola aggregata]QDU28359.1 Ribonuclease D [Anatilimnocola aggregata]
MQYEYITSHQHLRDFCEVIASAEIIAFDTEFVSEDTYLPELCLLQIAADGHLAIVDPLEFSDLTPFWELLSKPGKESLVHAGREEFRFCLRALGHRPTDWFDVQLAAGLVGLEYPASYGTLVQKLLGKSLSKDETRTDWRRRPLSQRQIEYGLQDVVDLQAIRTVLVNRLNELGRLEWVKSELKDWQDDVERAELGERWRRVGGLAGMSPRALAIVRELWMWRDGEGQRRNIPTRRILRDDLLLELAKRQTSDPKRMRAVRGMERGEILRHLPKIGSCVEKALAMKDDELPQTERRSSRPQLNLLGQFLSTALGSICRSAQVAPNLAGTAQDVRDLVAYRLDLGGFAADEKPLLATGWRAEVVGQVIDQLLSGELAIRIADPLDHEPLVFEPCTRGE